MNELRSRKKHRPIKCWWSTYFPLFFPPKKNEKRSRPNQSKECNQCSNYFFICRHICMYVLVCMAVPNRQLNLGHILLWFLLWSYACSSMFNVGIKILAPTPDSQSASLAIQRTRQPCRLYVGCLMHTEKKIQLPKRSGPEGGSILFGPNCKISKFIFLCFLKARLFLNIFFKETFYIA